MTETPSTTASATTTRRSDLIWSLAGRLGTTVANAGLMLTLSIYGLQDLGTFGVFALFVGGQILVSRGLLAGQEQALVRLHQTEGGGNEAVRAGLAVVLALGLVTVLLSPVGMFFPKSVLPAGWNPWMVPLVGFGATGFACFDAACASRLARLEYRHVGALQLGTALVRALATLAAAAFGEATVAPFVAFSGISLAAGGLAIAAAWLHAPGEVRRPNVVATLRYGRWIAPSDFAMFLALIQGMALLSWLGQKDESGLMAFAQQFGQGLFAVYLASYHTLLPRAARVARPEDLHAFLRRAYRYTLPLCGAVLGVAAAVYFAGPPILRMDWIDRPELAGFAPAFAGFTGFVVALLLEAPLGVTCHALLRPRLHLLAMTIRCASIFAFGLWLARDLGSLGAGLAQTAGGLVTLASLWFLVRLALPPEPSNADGGDAPCAAS